MVAKESSQDSLMDHQNPNPIMQGLDDHEEAEETLSLCDLPIYSGAAESENFSKEYQSSSFSSSDQDYFEFFSEEWSTPTTTYPLDNKNVVFCGKLIPYKQPVSIHTHNLETTKHKNPKRRGLFRWQSGSFNKAKTDPCNQKNESKLFYVSSSSSKSFSSSPVSEKYTYGSGKYGVSVRRVSGAPAPAAKCRWYLFMFGFARFPTEMELGDMRNRQYRRGPSTMFRSDSGGEKASGGWRRWKGLRGLIRALSMGGSNRANTVVKASFGCMPRV
ncbi:uncharacterized protein LOC132314309 [Cornus florida]|uniref:uncharacterized protein LOC132314309 n=1 Tax=Cornus florida TaxID=4283 RepID=UPI00289759AA|nr:uncharacterized protein LOC132314309 [Cornus florida]